MAPEALTGNAPQAVFRPVQKRLVIVLLVVAAFIFNGVVSDHGLSKGLLLIIALGIGLALHKAAFGFTGAYRKAFVARDLSGVAAQIVMIGLAIILFAPILAMGEVFGHGVGGALAPVTVSVVVGAFMFGIGMQLASGCASGTLFTVGGGSTRMVVVLICFCLGAFWGSLDLSWWLGLPSAGVISLGREWGWPLATLAQIAMLGVIYLALKKCGLKITRSLWWVKRPGLNSFLRGPWPLLWSGLLLALLNFATLLTAGHAWSVTWGFTLWGAEIAALFGWDPLTSSFWQGGFQMRALAGSLLDDTTSLMNIGIILGAFLSGALSGSIRPSFNIPLRSLLAAVIGGLMIGYGARLAFGCNIGALFSGLASASLHGWVWLIFALVGNYIGVWLRPLFGLDGFSKTN